jgi:hypothetical protein
LLQNTGMPSSKLQRITSQLQNKDIVEALSQLPGADFNTLMLEVYNRRASAITPVQLLQQYNLNRFVKPASVDCIAFMEAELAALKIFRKKLFEPILLSPLAPFGACSVPGTVNQDKVISAARSTEVMADATNAIALHIAAERQAGKITGLTSTHYSTIQRHVRSQPLPSPKFTAHFTIGCLVSSALDSGNFSFESSSLVHHLETWQILLSEYFGINELSLRMIPRNGYPTPQVFISHLQQAVNEQLQGIPIEVKENAESNNYYKGLQFKVVINVGGEDLEIADGGFVDWTAQLLGNKKERLLISGFGIELLYKLYRV